MLGAFREIKHHYNKPTQTFGCELLEWSERRVVLKYVNEETVHHEELGMEFPAGTTTIATYWNDRGFVVWQMYGPRGELLGYYVHIVEPVIIAKDAVEYRDAVIDIWFWPDGRHKVLDQDELDACIREGKISRIRERYIHEEKAKVLMQWERIVTQLPGADSPGRPPNQSTLN